MFLLEHMVQMLKCIHWTHGNNIGGKINVYGSSIVSVKGSTNSAAILARGAGLVHVYGSAKIHAALYSGGAVHCFWSTGNGSRKNPSRWCCFMLQRQGNIC